MQSQTNLLNEFIEQGYELENLKPYEEFLIECSQKDYGDLLTQKHHVLPKNMNGSNKKDNIIILSCEDHYRSHIILGECFELKTDERWKNTTSAGMILGSVKRLLRKLNGNDFDFESIDFWKEATIEVKKLYSGENNCNFNRDFSPEHRKRLSDAHKNRYLKYGSPFKEIKYTPERLQQMSDSRKGKFCGEDNAMFGISFADKLIEKYGEEEGLLRIEQHNKNISKTLFESSDKKSPLLEGLFRCDELICGHRKTCYRFCPNNECNRKLYYASKGAAKDAHQKNKFCKKCAVGYKTCNKFSQQVKDLETGIIYDSKNELITSLNIKSLYFLNKEIDLGKFELIGNKPKLDHKIRKRQDSEPFYNSIIYKDVESGQIYISRSKAKKATGLNENKLKKAVDEGRILIIKREDFYAKL